MLSSENNSTCSFGRILCFGASLLATALVVIGTSNPSQVPTQWLRQSNQAITASTISITDALNLLSSNMNQYGKAVDNEANDDAKTTAAIKVHDDHAILSGWTFLYRYPSTLSDVSTSSETEKPTIVVGVVSKSHHFKARQTVRQSWAADQRNRVYFVVAGPWKHIEQEFVEYGDLIWLNMDEDKSLTTNKVQLLFHAVHSHVDHYDYVLKTNDDSYIQLQHVQQHVATSKPDYWGNCQDSYYAHGMGYLVSREFNKCAASHIEAMGVFSSKEDVATGELADLCGVVCQKDGWDNDWIHRQRIS